MGFTMLVLWMCVLTWQIQLARCCGPRVYNLEKSAQGTLIRLHNILKTNRGLPRLEWQDSMVREINAMILNTCNYAPTDFEDTIVDFQVKQLTIDKSKPFQSYSAILRDYFEKNQESLLTNMVTSWSFSPKFERAKSLRAFSCSIAFCPSPSNPKGHFVCFFRGSPGTVLGLEGRAPSRGLGAM
ncbi:uncharacterized protein LOC131954903 [Physella acuta]|uniref:uncharacterized protein LOC131954903 n=1 Tax=Physella acuta TaxID=109671 RepID=UPI0027DD51ED|nr:uncharacterized protein LOC131954903 [Physella acuta]